MKVERQAPPAAASAVSKILDTRAAAREVVDRLREALPVRPDLLVVFGTYHHRALFSDAISTLRSELHPAHVLASTASGVLGDGIEIEQRAGLAAIALRLPGVVLRPFHFDIPDGPPSVWSEGFIRERVALPPDEGARPFRGTLLVCDPFTVQARQACAAIDAAAGPNGARIFGGLASGASQAGLNVLVGDRRVAHTGLVGLTVFGDVSLDGFVSQGCHAIGENLVVTKVNGHEVLEIGGRPALSVAESIAESLDEADRARLAAGLLVGVALDASKPRLGRDDFAVRGVHAVHPPNRSIVLKEPVTAGTTVRFHVRDSRTAHEDLDLLLDAQQLRGEAAGAIVFTCNTRGSRLFGEAGHDATLVSRRLGGAPIAGFQCAGEIGPATKRSCVHTQSASVAIFRAPRPNFTEV